MQPGESCRHTRMASAIVGFPWGRRGRIQGIAHADPFTASGT